MAGRPYDPRGPPPPPRSPLSLTCFLPWRRGGWDGGRGAPRAEGLEPGAPPDRAPPDPDPPPAPAPGRAPTCGGRDGALVALVKLEEEVKVELLVLLQPRHVGSGVRGPGPESGFEDRGPGWGSGLGVRVLGQGSEVRVGIRFGVWGRGWVGLLGSGWGPGSGSRAELRDRARAAGTCGRAAGARLRPSSAARPR